MHMSFLLGAVMSPTLTCHRPGDAVYSREKVGALSAATCQQL
jgi:hypothetical protein